MSQLPLPLPGNPRRRSWTQGLCLHWRRRRVLADSGGGSCTWEVWLEATYRVPGGCRVELAVGRDLRHSWMVVRRWTRSGALEVVARANGPRVDRLVDLAREVERGLLCQG